ncbi:putative translation releasing factor RF-1 [Drechmeria coniospora]|uniref:Putative translation releasing factor RF-1 n=1 Tax=Drechmeria coniospora TaxID=98403 RepID=A0A151GPU7_DRECN|nr:putative translation releasing factor RF-1 [Drechmeria coniospora]KYK59110.1 putative translation releasing factor RF-1 [Drechmeria coniospora]
MQRNIDPPYPLHPSSLSTDGKQDAELAAIARNELASELSRLKALERKLAASLQPHYAFTDLPCLIEFRPGPGGLKGRYFTNSLFKIYRALCARCGYRANVLKYKLAEAAGNQSSPAGEQPLQEAVLEVLDASAYDIFRTEAGIHCVQRIPSTKSKGRVYTLAVAVWVLPSFPKTGAASSDNVDDPESDFYLQPDDVRSKTMRACGAGGQYVNKTESAIRITHAPTGTVVSMQDHWSQQRNREAAWKQEAARLRSSILSKAQITRGDKIQTYNYNQDRCTDHRAGLNVHNLPDVLDGGKTLDRVMDAAGEWMVGWDLEAIVAEEEEARQK